MENRKLDIEKKTKIKVILIGKTKNKNGIV